MHKVLLIGLGYHARRIHVPILKELSSTAQLVAVVDVELERELITKYLGDHGLSPELCFLSNEQRKNGKVWRKLLDEIVQRHGVDVVLIATEPLSHFEYSMWALDKELHILLDKPISTAAKIANSLKIAKRNLEEYRLIEEKYKKVLKRKNVVFTILAQRRFHTAYDVARNAIKEIFSKTNCPVTLMSSLHCDGQWRFPDEIIEQDYHPYNSGYGKLSHSGYHSVDVLCEFTNLTHKGDKAVDSVEIYGQSSRPADFIAQLSIEDHKRLFKDSDKYFKYGNEYKGLMRSFGEIDVSGNITFKRNEQVITLGTLNLAHTGYGQRDWATAEGRDLYKGNGRVRQEQHVIEQGPFQSIFINSYQSKEILDENSDHFDIGGEHHLEIIIFRNNKLFPEWKPVEIINVRDLMNFELEGYSRGHQEEARRICIKEFFDYIDKDISPENQRSNFIDHHRTAVVFSGIYRSLAAKNSWFGKRIVTEKI